jgi:hypothetical protein
MSKKTKGRVRALQLRRLHRAPSPWRWRSPAAHRLRPLRRPAPADDSAVEAVVVTGFRASLANALDVKRRENDLVDVIKAQDIADFPDLNLAESLQRVPGVSIDRDGGEGRTITVRGLGPDFTVVRLNGLEALATTGGKDGSGGANRGRQFDFSIFASELFNSVTVRKSTSAMNEEGSLGAIIDLQAARPFDFSKFGPERVGARSAGTTSRVRATRATPSWPATAGTPASVKSAPCCRWPTPPARPARRRLLDRPLGKPQRRASTRRRPSPARAGGLQPGQRPAPDLRPDRHRRRRHHADHDGRRRHRQQPVAPADPALRPPAL